MNKTYHNKIGSGLICPYCSSGVLARSSERLSELLRRYYLTCRNHDCGAALVGNLEIIECISPSGVGNDYIDRQLSAPRLTR